MSEREFAIHVGAGPYGVFILQSDQFTPNQQRAILHICDRAGQEPVPPALVSPGSAPVAGTAGSQFGADAQADTDAVIAENRERARQYTARLEAKSAGYVGEPCQCGSLRTKRNGACLVCEDCGQTTGCS